MNRKQREYPVPQGMEERIETLFSILMASSEQEYIGEDISQLEHAIQTAELAQQQGSRPELITAALFHDLGHLLNHDAPQMDDLGVIDHEDIGAEFLSQFGFKQEVSDLIRLHVQAKRYLCWKKPKYYQQLSTASKGTLEWQGGPMSDFEGQQFEEISYFNDALKLRAWDEKAKRADIVSPQLSHFRETVKKAFVEESKITLEPITLNESQRRDFSNTGFLHLVNPFSADELQALINWVTELSVRPDKPGRWMKYYEGTGDERQLCRVENFVPFHMELKSLLHHPTILAVLHQLMGEPAVIYKEKMNMKLAGGQGFDAHQDAPAFATFGHSYHITMMISLDDSTPENGCLEFSDQVKQREIIPQNSGGALAASEESKRTWTPLTTKRGDIVFFDSYVPHRSGPNQSSSSRRALYVTYNPESQGDTRDRYFQEKRKHFPPDCERIAGVDYDTQSSPFNLGNPID
ncbi:MAG: phytanoyl-CoA dioxygenase family protein [Myxococcota bacterium]|nr:phytanoyl-CoA dioxygenase family protein [Myxococcota bacterium]